MRGCIKVSPAPVSTAMRSIIPPCSLNISFKHRSGSSGYEQAAAQTCALGVSDEEKQCSPKQIPGVLSAISRSMAARNAFSGSKSSFLFPSHMSMAPKSVSCLAISSSSCADP